MAAPPQPHRSLGIVPFVSFSHKEHPDSTRRVCQHPRCRNFTASRCMLCGAFTCPTHYSQRRGERCCFCEPYCCHCEP